LPSGITFNLYQTPFLKADKGKNVNIFGKIDTAEE
jgi:hypothetical protein